MKIKLSVFTIACVLIAQASMAQFALGIKGGVNMTKIDGKSFSDEFKDGYFLGGFLRIGGRLGIQPEVLFNQSKTRVDSSFKTVYQNATTISSYKDVTLNYLTIPVLLDYKVGSMLSLQAGPQFGILVSQDKSLLQNGQNAFKNGDLSLVAGAQLKILMLRLSARYAVGINNVSDISDQNKWKSQQWQLGVGFSL